MEPDNNESIMYLNPEECCQASTGSPNCPVYDGCYPNPTPEPTIETMPNDTPIPSPAEQTTPDPSTPTPTTPDSTPEPSMTTESIPSPKPTVCTEQLWYFDGEQCTREPDMEPDNKFSIMYLNPEECCQASTGSPSCPVYDGCYQKPTPEPSPSGTTQPTTCEERLWYFNSNSCTNGYDDTSNESGDIMYSTLLECCENEQSSLDCSYTDVCKPPTPAPSPGFGLEVFTYSPTFGSTPTVSKETTGPPTLLRGIRGTE